MWNPSQIPPSPRGKIFSSKLFELFEIHLSDHSLSLDFIAAYMAMSRTKLNRKTRSYTGMSVMQLLRAHRLNQATYMLSNSEDNIAEIAWLCGFQDPNYFCRAFKRIYGQPPSQYREKIWIPFPIYIL